MVPRCSSPRLPRPSAKRPEISGSVIDSSLSGSMRPLCIDAAHFATVDLSQPSAETSSFPLQEFVHFLLLASQGCPFLASGASL